MRNSIWVLPVFAMAAAVCAEIEAGPEAWRKLDLAIIPGITAMLAVAARVGAPLGHDFCALSLSDNLKPWEVIERRLDAAAGAGFVIALYNPISRARPWQLGAAFDCLGRYLTRPRLAVLPVGRADSMSGSTLGAAKAAEIAADMSTLSSSARRRRARAPAALCPPQTSLGRAHDPARRDYSTVFQRPSHAASASRGSA
jgi:precorrin-3B C17-methyltransferase